MNAPQFYLLLLLSASVEFSSVDGHAFLSTPITRNGVGIIERGYCSWNGDIPCTGCPHCWNVKEPTTGCGITQANSPPYVFDGGALSFANTGVKTTYTQGETIEMEVIISTYHGGRFQFRIQDVGDNDDPDGSLWESIQPLTVESYSPVCDDASEGCAADPCLAEKTCMYIPLQPYGDHNYFYTMQVKLPDELTCTHCVLQWHWLTSNSCPGDYIACQGSEEFWNCADLEILSGSVVPNSSPTPVPHACSTDTSQGDAACSGHGNVNCDYDPDNSCWTPVWSWPNDYCALQERKCQDWELQQGGGSWSTCCEFNDHCDGTGLFEPQISIDCKPNECVCFGGWEGDTCDICTAEAGSSAPTPATTTAPPAPSSAPVAPIPEPTEAPTEAPTADAVVDSPTAAPTTEVVVDPCEDSCYSTISTTAWYAGLVDAWCQVDCSAFTTAYPSRCSPGCRPAEDANNIVRRSLLGSAADLFFGSNNNAAANTQHGKSTLRGVSQVAK